MFDTLLRWLVSTLLWLRYRVTITGIEEIRRKGNRGILFLANHPALIDPIIVVTLLYKDFRVRPLGFQDQINRPVIRWLAERIHTLPIPDMIKAGQEGKAIITEAIQTIIAGLKQGENFILYPSGRTYRHRLEEIGGNSAVDTIVKAVPGARIVLIRTTGLWGSAFSWASGKPPKVKDILKKALFSILANGIFFTPRRSVNLQFSESGAFPRDTDRLIINRFLEDFYNENAPLNTYVPYTRWEKGRTRVVKEPQRPHIEGNPSAVPTATREQVLEYLKEVTGSSRLDETDRLSHDLGLDSLALVDLSLWLEQEFGFQQGYADSLRTVGDVWLAACGQAVASEPEELRTVGRRWFKATSGDRRVFPPEGQSIIEVFLNQAKSHPDQIIVADQVSGEKTYRDLITAIRLLKPEIEKIHEPHVGIMLPATVACVTLYLATLFAGKTPVMINWTIGSRNIEHALKLSGVHTVLTVKPVVTRLSAQGVNLTSIQHTFRYLEDVAKRLTLLRKLIARVASYLSWQPIYRTTVTRNAVMLFTSGSESLPKAVPLTHRNILNNIADVAQVLTIKSSDRLIGILPPFHALGITGTVILPVSLGVPTVYHPNPTEARLIADIIETYQLTLLLGTPTFLHGIVRSASPQHLETLRLAFVGAEKCPETVFQAIYQRCPAITVIEGYGTTECSPVVSVNDEKDPKMGTIGKVLPSFEYTLMDPEIHRTVERGQRGILLVRGPAVFNGYYCYEGPSPFVEFEGKTWYRTGDLVVEDEDCVLSFAGRLKRFVKLGGEMISLPAIEETLAPHFVSPEEDQPSIAIEATSDETHPELVLFTTVPVERHIVNHYIREAGLSPLHHIRRVVLIDSIPLLGTGKTDYLALKRKLENH